MARWRSITRYTCSNCGYTRDTIEPVIEHIVETHEGDGHVMEHETDDPADPSWLDRLLG